MPFVEPGDAHRDSFPTEGHTAFYIGFAAHVESTGLRKGVAEGRDDLRVHTGADEHLRPIWASRSRKSLPMVSIPAVQLGSVPLVSTVSIPSSPASK